MTAAPGVGEVSIETERRTVRNAGGRLKLSGLPLAVDQQHEAADL
jgi:hypothetical protein